MTREDHRDGLGGDTTIESVRNARRDAMRAAARKPSQALRSTADLARSPPIPAHKDKPAGELSVFVSYAHADLDIVRGEVLRLRNAGLAVTWDQDFLGGSDFELEIRRAIDAAGAVIAVWSTASVASPFVKDEARRAMTAGKLVTTHIDGLDFNEIPLGFGHLHVVALTDHNRVERSLAVLIGAFQA